MAQQNNQIIQTTYVAIIKKKASPDQGSSIPFEGDYTIERHIRAIHLLKFSKTTGSIKFEIMELILGSQTSDLILLWIDNNLPVFDNKKNFSAAFLNELTKQQLIILAGAELCFIQQTQNGVIESCLANDFVDDLFSF